MTKCKILFVIPGLQGLLQKYGHVSQAAVKMTTFAMPGHEVTSVRHAGTFCSR